MRLTPGLCSIMSLQECHKDPSSDRCCATVWRTQNNLTWKLKNYWLSEHKTEAILIYSRKDVEFICVPVGNCEIKRKQYLKYLGVILDN